MEAHGARLKAQGTPKTPYALRPEPYALFKEIVQF